MIKYTHKLYITEIRFNNKDITVEYNFSKAELGHFDGTGTFDGVEIVKILIDTTDITNLVHYDYLTKIERIVFDKHIN
tara:strand:+ start:193 stop:426 length:234 start_codon:yes stop_codon:yes gene_type:complete